MGAAALALQIFFGLCLAGIVLPLFISERLAPRALAWLGALASLAVLWTGGSLLIADGRLRAVLWEVRGIGELTISPDRLSAVFLIVAGLVFLAASVFSRAYLTRYLGHYSLRVFEALYFPLFASVVLVLIAGDVLLFLLAWEAMSILSYLLVNFEYKEETHTQAGYLMLAMGEAGTLAAIVALLLLATPAGSLEFSTLKASAAGLGAGVRWTVFLLSFFGFGVKAGLVPFNSWLPRAHPVAPGNVSAILSGTILNLGLYGIVRVNVDLLPMTLVGPGLVALVVGTVSAFIGILYATTENDLKVMLAHSSIENIGIVTAGLGAGFVFTAAKLPTLATLAFVTALYHMTNHSLYKALLFLGAATVDSEVGTRDLDRLGGLVRRLPLTTLFFLVGALSISALPPFNGFVSEWLTLQTMLRSAELGSRAVKVVFALCGAGLALTAALAVTCFVKAVAMGFLGKARSEAERTVHESRSMIASMGLLAALCLVLGVLPTVVIPTLSSVLTPMTGASAVDALVPPFFAGSAEHSQLPADFATEFHDLGAQVGQDVLPGRGLVVMHRGGAQNPVVFAMSTSYMLPVLIALLAIAYGIVRLGLARRRGVVRRACWDGGVQRLLPEMTYTATGFSNPVRVIFDAILQPTAIEDTRETVAEHFRTAIRRQRKTVHIVDRVVLAPLKEGGFKIANGLAAMHHGRINAYIAYGLLTLVVALIVGSQLSKP
jgi:hydrogenase-4 component B